VKKVSVCIRLKLPIVESQCVARKLTHPQPIPDTYRILESDISHNLT